MAGSTPASRTSKAGVLAQARSVSPWAEAWRRFMRHRLALASLFVLLAIVVLVLFGPLVWKLAINDIDFSTKLQGPSLAHPMGTDDLGQDLFARMLYGGRISLAVGLMAMLMAASASLFTPITGVGFASARGLALTTSSATASACSRSSARLIPTVRSSCLMWP